MQRVCEDEDIRTQQSRSDVLRSDALIRHAFKFLPDDCFRYIAGVNPKFRSCYLKRQQEGETERTPAYGSKKRKTCLVHAVATTGQAKVFFKEPRALRPPSFCSRAAKHGKLDILKLARANSCLWDSSTCAYAAKGGHLEVLQWVRSNGCDWNRLTCFNAAKAGHLDVLQWARANGCDWDWHTCSYAARGGHLDVLQGSRRNGCDWDTDTCSSAARRGHLHVLKWARANGCDSNFETCHFAAFNGHLELLQWARASGCDWDSATCLAWAGRWAGGRAENMHVVQWIQENCER